MRRPRQKNLPNDIGGEPYKGNLQIVKDSSYQHKDTEGNVVTSYSLSLWDGESIPCTLVNSAPIDAPSTGQTIGQEIQNNKQRTPLHGGVFYAMLYKRRIPCLKLENQKRRQFA